MTSNGQTDKQKTGWWSTESFGKSYLRLWDTVYFQWTDTSSLSGCALVYYIVKVPFVLPPVQPDSRADGVIFTAILKILIPVHHWLWSVWGHSIGLLKRRYFTVLSSHSEKTHQQTHFFCAWCLCVQYSTSVLYTQILHMCTVAFMFMFASSTHFCSMNGWAYYVECWLSAQNLINCTSRSSQHSVGFTDSTWGREPSLSSAEISGLHRKQQFLDGHKRMMKLLEPRSGRVTYCMSKPLPALILCSSQQVGFSPSSHARCSLKYFTVIVLTWLPMPGKRGPPPISYRTCLSRVVVGWASRLPDFTFLYTLYNFVQIECIKMKLPICSIFSWDGTDNKHEENHYWLIIYLFTIFYCVLLVEMLCKRLTRLDFSC